MEVILPTVNIHLPEGLSVDGCLGDIEDAAGTSMVQASILVSQVNASNYGSQLCSSYLMMS